MFIWFTRFIKRLAVLTAGLLSIYLAVWKFFPFFDHRVPIALALFATYVVTAYFFIPSLVRLLRLFIIPDHIPLYCVTPDGFASDPVNIGIIGTKKELIYAMIDAGWYKADAKTIRSSAQLIVSTFFRQPYLNAPFSTLYLFGRGQDVGFERPVEGSTSKRHHVRFWACHLDGPEAFHGHVRFWKRFHTPAHDDGRQLWVGAASKDKGIIPIRHNAQLTHMVDSDTNKERDLIVDTLRSAHKVAHMKTAIVGAAYEVRNRTIGGILRTDGKIRICILKN